MNYNNLGQYKNPDALGGIGSSVGQDDDEVQSVQQSVFRYKINV